MLIDVKFKRVKIWVDEGVWWVYSGFILCYSWWVEGSSIECNEGYLFYYGIVCGNWYWRYGGNGGWGFYFSFY